MYLLSLLIGTALAASANWCGTSSPSSQELAAIMSLQAAEKDGSLLHRRQNELIDIPVYVTGIVNSTNSDDELSQAVLEEQVDVLVDRFAPYDITFTVQNITRLVDDDLSQGYSSNGWNLYKYKARKGGYGTLNLYYVTNMDDTVWSAGACTLPSDNITDASPFYYKLDGCTLTSYTVPGGIDADGKVYKGEISVHEVGHWLSLVHTFQGNSCDGPGDYIDDTPQEEYGVKNVCPIGRDSCPDQPGLDPIDNYMDLAGEGCWTQFTPLQTQRMRNAYFVKRAPYSWD